MHTKINHLLSVLVSNKVHAFELKELQDNLQLESTVDANYLSLIFASCAISLLFETLRERHGFANATFGLLSNSAAVIIGAMIIAPLMLPIRGLAFGALEGDLKLFRIAFQVGVGSAIAISLAWIIGLLSGISSYGSEIYARSQPNLLDLAIAIVALWYHRLCESTAQN
ncbi:MAG: DUF389 domain-containing protein [Rivularia sp. (in: cyanobacteria)]